MGLTDEQRQRLREVLTDPNAEVPRLPNEHTIDHAVRAVALLIEPWLAEAWEAGFNAGEEDVHEHERLGDWESPCIPNPYRAAIAEEGDRG